MKSQDLDTIQKRLQEVLALPTVPDFSNANLLLLAHTYGSTLIQICQSIHTARDLGAGDFKPTEQNQRLITYISTNRQLEYASINVGAERQLTLNWQEIYEVLNQAFSDIEQHKKGCELLQTLDYKISNKNRDMSVNFISWLQQAHRYKDQQLKSIYYRLMNLSFEDSKDDQTFPVFVSLVHSQIDAIFDMRNNYIRTIQQLNSQITDLIAQNTKNQIRQGSRHPLNEIKVSQNTPLRIHHSEQKRYQMAQQRQTLEKSVEDMLGELLSLKNDNQQLKVRLFERDKQLKNMAMRQDKLNTTVSECPQHKHKEFLHNVQRQLVKLVNLLSNISNDPQFKKSILGVQTQLRQSQDITNCIMRINHELDSIIGEDMRQSVGNHSIIKSIRAVADRLDKLIVSEGKEGKQIDNLQRLFVQIRKLQHNVLSELKAEEVAPKLMGVIARVQKAVGKADKRLSGVLQMQRTYILELLSQMVPTDRAYQIGDQLQETKADPTEMTRLREKIEQLKTTIKITDQKALEAEQRRDQIARTVLDASKRVSQLQKEKEVLGAQKTELVGQIKKLKQTNKQQQQQLQQLRQTLGKRISSKDNQIHKLNTQLKSLQTDLISQRKMFAVQRSRLAQQIQLTGSKLQQIERLADRKLNDRNNRGTPLLRKRV